MGLMLGFMLLLSGLFELHLAVNWKYFDRGYASVSDYVAWSKNEDRNPEQQSKLYRKCVGFCLQNAFRQLTLLVALFVAFSATLPYLFPIWVLMYLPKGWKKHRWWQVSDNLVSAVLFFAATMVVFVANTTNFHV